jgi:hypothetical protein
MLNGLLDEVAELGQRIVNRLEMPQPQHRKSC